MKNLLLVTVFAAAAALPAHADDTLTLGVGVPGSSSKPYGTFGAAVARAHRDAKGAIDVVPTDRNGRPAKAKAGTQVAGLGVVEWNYKIFVIHHNGGYSYLQPTTFGPYASEERCEQTRAENITNMEKNRNPDGSVAGGPDKNFIRERAQLKPGSEGTYSTSDSSSDWSRTYSTSDSSSDWSRAGGTRRREHSETRPIIGPIEVMLPSDCAATNFVPLSNPMMSEAERHGGKSR